MLRLVLLVVSPLLLVAYLLKEALYRRFRQYANLPQLKTSFVFGHMKRVHEFMQRGAPEQHFDITAIEIWNTLGRPPLFLMDLRPVQYALVVVTSHVLAEEICSSSSLFPWSVDKSPTTSDSREVIGDHSMVAANGEDWKSLRKVFNPGFAHNHLMTLLPLIMDKTWLFLRHLDSYAKTGEEFGLGILLTNLTFDVIGTVTLELDFGAQLDNSSKSQFIKIYQQLLATFRDDDSPFPNPRKRLTRWRYGRTMDPLLTDMVRKKLAEFRRQDSKTKSRSIVALASKDMDSTTPQGLALIVDQVKTFLFAGHDTTSVILQWAIYYLSRNPRALQRVRSELDDIFGPDAHPAAVRDRLLGGDSDALSRMTYTSAVIKEAMRLNPPAGTARVAPRGKGFRLRMPDGSGVIDADGMVLYVCHTILQRDPAVYGETANDFVPERWLGDTNTSDADSTATATATEKTGSGGIPASAWRPFERGPRNCIGQALANIEMRLILALVVRRYDFTKVGLGEPLLDANGMPRLNAKGEYEVKSEIYNTRQVTSRPIDNMMMKVKLSPKATFDL